MLKTKEKFESGSVSIGDRFSEMFSHWKVIIDVRDNGEIITLEGNSSKLDVEVYKDFNEFKYRCSYKNIDGYWIDFIDNNRNRVRDFLERYYELRKDSARKKDIRNWETVLNRDIAIDKLIFNI